MAALQRLLLLLCVFLGQTAGQARKCYSCGYMIKGDAGPVAIADLPFCGDFTTPTDNTATCGTAEDCCGSLKEYTSQVNEEGMNMTVTIARHGCKSDVDHFGEYSASCTDQANSCWTVDDASLPNHEGESTVTMAEICLCDTDLCNTKDPNPTAPPGPSKTCYDCGYKCINMAGATCTPEPIDTEGHIPFCADKASMASHTKECGGGDECCGALREYIVMTDAEGKTTTDMITWHGCEADLAANSNINVLCNGHTNACYNISKEDIHDETLSEAKACFCDGDRCNNAIPDLPFPHPTPTQSKTCYDCGYICKNVKPGDDCIPAPTPNIELNFCSDLATLASKTKQCTGADECCGSLAEYMEIKNPETNVTTIDKIVYHGCEKDLAEALNSNIGVICDGHTNSCYNVSRDDIQDEFLVKAEACFCEGDRCNNKSPDLPDTMPTSAPSSAKSHTFVCLVLWSCFVAIMCVKAENVASFLE